MEKDLESLVKKAIEKLPEEIRRKIENTAICIEDEPTVEQLAQVKVKNKDDLLGLYQGVPRNVWGRGFGNQLPDKITIFRKAIEKHSPNGLEETIKNVVWHEIAHHFGFDEKKARERERG
jgi:predicted Zn-dependent protease with MMP-like domain